MRQSPNDVTVHTNPIIGLVVLPRPAGVRQLVVRVVAVNEILHDGTALEQVDRLAISEGVRYGRNASIGVDLEEPGLLRRGICLAFHPEPVCLDVRVEGYLLCVLADVDLGGLFLLLVP